MLRPAALPVLLPAAVAAGLACADPAPAPTPQPREFQGRWVRLRPDGGWGDTMAFRPDGAILGSAGYPVPASLRWEVKRDPAAGPQFCAAVAGDGFCRAFRLAGDELVLFGGPNGDTRFRRVR